MSCDAMHGSQVMVNPGGCRPRGRGEPGTPYRAPLRGKSEAAFVDSPVPERGFTTI